MKDKEIYQRISSNPDIMHGKACVKGTRIPVYLIVSLIAEGVSIKNVIKDYPSLTADDIKAAIYYSAKLCKYEAYSI